MTDRIEIPQMIPQIIKIGMKSVVYREKISWLVKKLIGAFILFTF